VRKPFIGLPLNTMSEHSNTTGKLL